MPVAIALISVADGTFEILWIEMRDVCAAAACSAMITSPVSSPSRARSSSAGPRYPRCRCHLCSMKLTPLPATRVGYDQAWPF